MSHSSKNNRSKLDHSRWLISYADFITLLFAFFVVMYAIASMNISRYEALSKSLGEAFKQKSEHQTKEKVDLERTDKKNAGKSRDNKNDDALRSNPAVSLIEDSLGNHSQETELSFEGISKAIYSTMKDLINEGLLKVTSSKDTIKIEIKSELLFLTGSANPSIKSIPIMKSIAKILNRNNKPIFIQGHTDNQPIKNYEYPSNWELSAARSSGIARTVVRGGVDPKRIAVIGYGQFQPLTNNKTRDSRRQNRRVEIIILKDETLANRLFTSYPNQTHSNPSSGTDSAVVTPASLNGTQ